MLYLHIPYCHRKCSYCAFYSVVTTSSREKYIDALCRELKYRGTGRSLKTIYFGGGTPSMLSIGEIAHIVEAIKTNFDCSQVEEVTIEANPEDLSTDYLVQLADLGFFNRLSIGVQSFDDIDLRRINRRHDSRQAIQSVENASKAGFDNVSVDLIMGLPGQDADGFERNLQCLGHLLSLGCVKHLSCYELTVEPDTILDRQIASGRLQLPDEETLVKEYGMLQEWCAKNGFVQYEVSNYCIPGFRSLHNSRYWNRTPYIGVGAGAHSFDGERRRWNLSDVGLYTMSDAAPFEEEQLTSKDAFNEYVMTALRTIDGIDKSILKKMISPERYSEWETKTKGLVSAGLLIDTDSRIIPSSEGMLHSDGISVMMFDV